MAAATSAQIKTALANLLKVTEASLADHWEAISVQAQTFADQEVKGRLYRRGFTAANVADWDRLFEVTLDLGLWRCIMLGGVYSGFDANVIKALDRRDELDGILVFVNGEWVQPPMGQPGTITTAGQMAEDPGGVFNWNPRDDPNKYGIEW